MNGMYASGQTRATPIAFQITQMPLFHLVIELLVLIIERTNKNMISGINIILDTISENNTYIPLWYIKLLFCIIFNR